MTRALPYLLPLFIASVGIVACQVAGGPWWVALFAGGFGPDVSLVMGWALSLAWEAGSVWGWLTGQRLVAGVATFMLLVGMVGHGAGRLLEERARADAQRAGLESRAEILSGAAAREAGALDSHQRTAESQAAAGWAGMAGRSQRAAGAGLEQARALDTQRLQTAGQLAALSPTTWLERLRPWATLIVFPALYFMVISALLALREYHTGRHPDGAPDTGQSGPDAHPDKTPPTPRKAPNGLHPSHPPDTPDATPDNSRRRAVIDYGKRHHLTTQAEVARAIQLDPRRLSEWLQGKAGEEQRAEIEERLKK